MPNKKYVKKCKFNIDTGCVKVVFADGRIMSIDCTFIEDKIACNRFER